jgi:hypothetical protein
MRVLGALLRNVLINIFSIETDLNLSKEREKLMHEELKILKVDKKLFQMEKKHFIS